MKVINQNSLRIMAQGLGDQCRILHHLVEEKLKVYGQKHITVIETIPPMGNTRFTCYNTENYEYKRNSIIYPRHKLLKDFNISFIIQDLYMNKSIYIDNETIEYKNLDNIKDRKNYICPDYWIASKVYQLFENIKNENIVIANWEAVKCKHKPKNLYDHVQLSLDHNYLKYYFQNDFSKLPCNNIINFDKQHIKHLFKLVQNAKFIIAPEGGISHLAIYTNKPLALVIPNKMFEMFQIENKLFDNELEKIWISNFFKNYFRYHYHHNKLCIVFENDLFNYYNECIADINAFVESTNNCLFAQPTLIDPNKENKYQEYFDNILKYSLYLKRFYD